MPATSPFAWNDNLPPSEQVLVALMNNCRDFERARDEGWYRIPVKSAPRAIDAARIAFYQTQVFGDEKWQVKYHAEVRFKEILKRRDLLPDESDHPRAEMPYYRLNLNGLQELKRPIISRSGRRLVFISTTRRKFQLAREINDLFHDSPLEDELWRTFKRARIRAERQLHINANKRKYCLDFALHCLRGGIDIECDGDAWHSRVADIARDNQRDNDLTSQGWAVLRFNTQSIKNDLTGCLSLVRQTIAGRGGLQSA